METSGAEQEGLGAGYYVMRVFGFIGFGLLMLALTLAPLGVIGLEVGIILAAIGLILNIVFLVVTRRIKKMHELRLAEPPAETSPEPAPNQPSIDQFIEVVYLKNGSIIKGIIVEQVLGESLKIQTADGSLFVFKLEEVLKTTKEPIKK